MQCRQEILYTEQLCRVLLILWGTNKFLKKLIKPKAVNNNELADFISRVPDNEELVLYIDELLHQDYFSFLRKTSKKFPKLMKLTRKLWLR